MADPPPLPETDDPYVLLGLAPEPTDKEIRAAYARMIKLYRPDRAPDAFERIHAAYEILRGDGARRHAAMRFVAIDRFAASRTAPEPAPEPAAPRRFIVAGELGAAIAAGDLHAVDAALERALAASVPIDDVLERLTREECRVVLSRPALTWGSLIGGHDRHVAHAIVESAIRARLDGDAPATAADVLDKQWFRDAADDDALAALGWWTASAVAWHAPVKDLVARLQTLPHDDAADRVIDHVGLDLDVADRLRGSHLRPPPEIATLLRIDRFATPEERQRAANAAVAAARRDPDGWLATFDAIQTGNAGAAEALHTRFLDGTIAERSNLVTVLEDAPERFRELTRMLTEAGRGGAGWLHVGGGAALVAGMRAIAPFSVALATAGLVGSSIAAYLATERRRYRRVVRPRLARVLAVLGVTAGCARRWVTVNKGLAGRLATYDIAIDEDQGLHIAGAAMAWAASVAEDT